MSSLLSSDLSWPGSEAGDSRGTLGLTMIGQLATFPASDWSRQPLNSLQSVWGSLSGLECPSQRLA